jgi:outer membrane protein TolC
MTSSQHRCRRIRLLLTITLGLGLGGSAVRSGETDANPALANPLSLEQARRLAVQDNPSMAASRARVEAAAEALGQVRSQLYPSITANVSGVYNHEVPGNNTDSLESYSAGVEASWLLFNGLQRKFDILAAGYRREAREQADREAQRLLLQSVTLVFNNALLASENMRISRQNADFNQELTNETQTRFDAGAAAKSEVLNFRIRTAEAESQHLGAQRDYNLYRHALAGLLALPEQVSPTDIEPAAPEHVIPEDWEMPAFEDEFAYALTHRPDYLSTLHYEDAAGADLAAAKGAHWPRVALVGSYSVNRDENPRFRADERAATAESERVRLTVMTDVRDQLEALRVAYEQVLLQRQIYDMTTETRDLVRREYVVGRSSLTRLNEAQTDLVRASGNLARARIVFRQARSDLASATGRDLLRAGL